MLRKQVIIDTDIWDYIDDAFALAFALNSPEIEIKAIFTNNGREKARAQIAKKLVGFQSGDIQILQGVKGGKGGLNQDGFIKGFKFEPQRLQDKVDFIKSTFLSKTYYISLGSLSNVLFLLQNIPCMEDETEFFIVGGAIGTDYHGKKKLIPEWNIASDIEASRGVFSYGARITLIPLDCTWNLVLAKESILQVENSGSRLNKALTELYVYWKRRHLRVKPLLCDPFAVALVIDSTLAAFQDYRIVIDNKGRIIQDSENGKNVTVAIESDKQRFMKLLMDRLLSQSNGKLMRDCV